MAPTHKLIIKSREGVRRGELIGTSVGGTRSGFLTLATSMEINAPGVLTFNVRADNVVIDMLEDDAQIEHWRDNTMLFRGLYQGPQFQLQSDGQEIMTAVCAGEKHLLSRAAIMWRANVANRSKFVEVAADAIMHDLVQYNITPDATEANGRLVTNPMSIIAVEDEVALGAMIAARESSGKPLLSELQEIALAGGVDFDLIKTGDYAWVFRTYYPQRGTDRSASLIFYIGGNNLAALAYSYVKTDSKTVAVAGGEGEEDERLYTVRYGPDYSPYNHREVFISQTSSDSLALIQAEADQQLEQLRPKKSLTFEVLQTSNAQFGVDYFLGDIVKGKYRDVVSTYKVRAATITLASGSTEQIQVELLQQ